MATRTPRASRKATIVDVPFVETVAPAAPQLSAFEAYKARAHKAIDEMLALPEHGWMRAITAWIVTLASSIGIGWLVGTITTYAIVGAALLTSSAFVALAILLIGIAGSMYISYKTSPIVFMAVIDGTVEKAAARAWKRTKAFFTPSSKLQAAAS